MHGKQKHRRTHALCQSIKFAALQRAKKCILEYCFQANQELDLISDFEANLQSVFVLFMNTG